MLNLIGGSRGHPGEVTTADIDLAKLDRDERTTYRRDRVGFVFQFFNLVPTLTALENVQLLAEVTGGDAEARSPLHSTGSGSVTWPTASRDSSPVATTTGRDRPRAGEGATAAAVR